MRLNSCLLVLALSASLAPADEKSAIERLKKAGATVRVDSSAKGPARLRVTFDRLDDKQAAVLKSTPEVLALVADDASRFTDRGMAQVAGLTNLEEISLTRPAITNSGMASIKKLANLQRLFLFDSKITDAGLAPLKSLDKLEELDLSGSRITSEAGATFKEIEHLKLLVVSRTKFGEAGVKHLKGLKDLRKFEAIAADVSVKAAKELEEAVPGVSVRR